MQNLLLNLIALSLLGYAGVGEDRACFVEKDCGILIS